MSNQYNVEDLANNLNYLNETKSLIKNAIREKGQEVLDDDTFRSYAAKIDNISGGGAGQNSNILHFSNEEEMNSYNIANIGDKAFVYDKDNTFYKGIFEYSISDEIAGYNYIKNITLHETTIDVEMDNDYISIDTLKQIKNKLLTLVPNIDDKYYVLEKLDNNRFKLYYYYVDLYKIPIMTAELEELIKSKYTFKKIPFILFNPDLNILPTDNLNDDELEYYLALNLSEMLPINEGWFKVLFLGYSNEVFANTLSLDEYVIDLNQDSISKTSYSDLMIDCADVSALSYVFYSTLLDFRNKKLSLVNISDIDSDRSNLVYLVYLQNNTINYKSEPTISNVYANKFLKAPVSFTADSTKVINGWFYGSNGVEQGEMFDSISYSNEDIDKLPKRLDTYYEIERMNKINSSTLNNCYNYFKDCHNLVIAPNFDTSNVINMSGMFSNCENLIIVPNYNTINVTNMANMFTYSPKVGTNRIGCRIETVPNFNTSNVTSIVGMFRNCNKLISVPNFNTSKINNMSNIFQNCINLIAVPNFDTSNVTSMRAFLDDCHNLIAVPNFNTSKVTIMTIMLENCYNLTSVPNFNTINVTLMNGMFEGCHNLTSVPNFNTINVNSMPSMFYDCYNLTTVPKFNTSKVTSMTTMFYNCNNLTNASVQNIINMILNSNVTDVNLMNLYTNNASSPFYSTKFNNTYYSNRLTELRNKGWVC